MLRLYVSSPSPPSPKHTLPLSKIFKKMKYSISRLQFSSYIRVNASINTPPEPPHEHKSHLSRIIFFKEKYLLKPDYRPTRR